MKKLDVGPRNGHYSSAAVSGNLIFISGQLSIDPDTGAVPSTIYGETVSALKKVERIASAAGSSREGVLQCRVYMTDIALREEMNRAYADFFGAHRPARAAVPVTALNKACNIEIEAVAEIPGGKE